MKKYFFFFTPIFAAAAWLVWGIWPALWLASFFGGGATAVAVFAATYVGVGGGMLALALSQERKLSG